MRYVALLRGVNVGGGNKVPMAALRAACADLGWKNVRTYIASGNLIFDSDGDRPALARDLQGLMREKMGVDVPVLVLSGEELRRVLSGCPFEVQDGKHLHCAFHWLDASLDQDLYESLKIPSEAIKVDGKIAWIHTPEGFGRSKLAEKLGKVLSQREYTARNLNTVRKLVEMLDG